VSKIFKFTYILQDLSIDSKHTYKNAYKKQHLEWSLNVDDD